MLLIFHFTCDRCGELAPHKDALKFAVAYSFTALRANLGV